MNVIRSNSKGCHILLCLLCRNFGKTGIGRMKIDFNLWIWQTIKFPLAIQWCLW